MKEQQHAENGIKSFNAHGGKCVSRHKRHSTCKTMEERKHAEKIDRERVWLRRFFYFWCMGIVCVCVSVCFVSRVPRIKTWFLTIFSRFQSNRLRAIELILFIHLDARWKMNAIRCKLVNPPVQTITNEVYIIYILTVRRENWNLPKVISFFVCLMQILCDFAEGSLPENRFKPHFACIPHIVGILKGDLIQLNA